MLRNVGVALTAIQPGNIVVADRPRGSAACCVFNQLEFCNCLGDRDLHIVQPDLPDWLIAGIEQVAFAGDSNSCAPLRTANHSAKTGNQFAAGVVLQRMADCPAI